MSNSNVFFNWDQATLSVGVDRMDQEHKVLISIMNKLYERNAAKAPKAELFTTMEEFFRFLKVWLIAHIEGIDKQYGSYAK